ncbi:hypothetical protein [Chitiniphilus eburneus]|uniref:hypothetical protein n=1 Tax=Chitiniphilus eburneus TaxID=2571148 RepID=UPI0035CFD2BA
MKKIFIGFLLACTAGLASASYQTGKITSVITRADGLVYLFIENGALRAGKPSCATSNYWMVRDENSQAGKNQLATLMTAYATGATIAITGSGTCNRWSDGEDIFIIELK